MLCGVTHSSASGHFCLLLRTLSSCMELLSSSSLFTAVSKVVIFSSSSSTLTTPASPAGRSPAALPFLSLSLASCAF